MSPTRGLLALVFLAAARPVVWAQDSTRMTATMPTPGCAVLNGIRISASWGDSTGAGRRADTARTRFLVDGRTTIDTTLTFNVADRQWSRPSLDAMVAAGASSRASSAPWRACVGITVGMQQPTIALRGVRGQLHLKVDLTSLARIPGSGLSDSSRQNPSRR